MIKVAIIGVAAFGAYSALHYFNLSSDLLQYICAGAVGLFVSGAVD